MIIIMGKSGSGKSTLEKEMEIMGFKRSISHTTRGMRKGEKEGVTYFYVTEEKINSLDKAGKMVEKERYGGNYYGLSKEQVGKDSVAVIEPRGTENIIDKGYNPFVVYLEISDKIRKERMSSRGDTPTDIENRMGNDEEIFKGADKIADYVVNVDKKTVEDIKEVAVNIKGMYERHLQMLNEDA